MQRSVWKAPSWKKLGQQITNSSTFSHFRLVRWSGSISPDERHEVCVFREAGVRISGKVNTSLIFYPFRHVGLWCTLSSSVFCRMLLKNINDLNTIVSSTVGKSRNFLAFHPIWRIHGIKPFTCTAKYGWTFQLKETFEFELRRLLKKRRDFVSCFFSVTYSG